jgi:Mor family transcriptional regulator
MSKLTAEIVLEIRQEFAAGTHKNDLAKRFNVTVPNIRAIVTRKSWKHI